METDYRLLRNNRGQFKFHYKNDEKGQKIPEFYHRGEGFKVPFSIRSALRTVTFSMWKTDS